MKLDPFIVHYLVGTDVRLEGEDTAVAALTGFAAVTGFAALKDFAALTGFAALQTGVMFQLQCNDLLVGDVGLVGL